MKTLLKAYNTYFGKPDEMIDIAAGTKAFKLGVKNPQPDYDMPDSIICSVGLSLISKKAEFNIELVIDIKGKVTKKKLAEVGSYFAEVFDLIEKGAEILPGEMYKPKQVLFEGRNYVTIIDSGYRSVEYLDSENEKARIIRVLPLYESEAKELETVDSRLREWMLEALAMGKLSDPKRKETQILNLAMIDRWRNIAEWYEENKVAKWKEIKKALDEGKRKPVTKFKKAAGFELPPDYKASLEILNFIFPFMYYDMYTEAQIIETMSGMNDMNKKGVFKPALKKLRGDKRLQQAWWHEKWIPIGMDSVGRFLCIDMAPGPHGIEGQIFFHDKIEGPVHMGHESFYELLFKYHGDLRSKRFEVSDGGHLNEV